MFDGIKTRTVYREYCFRWTCTCGLVVRESDSDAWLGARVYCSGCGREFDVSMIECGNVIIAKPLEQELTP